MKRVLLVLAVAGVMVSCGSKKKADKGTTTDTATTTTTDKMGDQTSTSTATTSGVPTFADAEVQKYVNDYTAFVTSYVDAYKAKDMTKVQELATKMQDWSSRSISVSQKLAANPEEARKFSDYI